MSPGNVPQNSMIWIGDFRSLREAKQDAVWGEFGPIRMAGGKLLPLGLTLIKATAVPDGAKVTPLPRGSALIRSLRMRALDQRVHPVDDRVELVARYLNHSACWGLSYA